MLPFLATSARETMVADYAITECAHGARATRSGHTLNTNDGPDHSERIWSYPTQTSNGHHLDGIN